MQLYKCKMCGGNVNAAQGESFGVCDSCGSAMTLPGAADERIVNLFNRANYLRLSGEFDKALAAYESILLEDNENAEAHWGALLCRFGIEYVEDPDTRQRIPTCHRAQFEPLLTDPDFLAACRFAPDERSQTLYREQGAAIAEIQRSILAVSEQTEPFDVFLCYKESARGGARTKDSVKAQEIYYALTDQGYRVFFARITLENKIGREYEPYIFAALHSARVMLVIGAKKENFSAVWVKNEWSRFLALMKQDRTRLLIPCYQDMSPYDLPEELSYLQAQDMGKIGFLQDLLHGMKKVLAAGRETPAAAAEPARREPAPAPAADVSALIKRMYIVLEDGDFNSAGGYSQRILEAAPEDAHAYVGQLMAEKKLRRRAELSRVEKLPDELNFQRALRYADAALRAELNGYLHDLQYEKALQAARKAVMPQEMLEPMQMLQQLAGYKDADDQLQTLKERVYRTLLTSWTKVPKAEDCLPLIALMRLMPGYKNVDEIQKTCCEKVYKAAVERSLKMASGCSQAAAALFEALGNYKDSQLQAKSCLTFSQELAYQQAVKLSRKAVLKEDFEVVENAFLAARDTRDAGVKAAEYRRRKETYDAVRDEKVEKARRRVKILRWFALLLLLAAVGLSVYYAGDWYAYYRLGLDGTIDIEVFCVLIVAVPLLFLIALSSQRRVAIRQKAFDTHQKVKKYRKVRPVRFFLYRLLSILLAALSFAYFFWKWATDKIYTHFEEYLLDPIILCILLLMISSILFSATRRNIPLQPKAKR